MAAGSHKSESGSTYIGSVDVNNRRAGSGQEAYSVGGTYKGEYKDDLRHGQGEMRFATGEIYRGEWRADQQVGVGTYEFENGAWGCVPNLCAAEGSATPCRVLR